MSRLDVDGPLWDQSHFYGRFRHFAWVTNPLNGLSSEEELLRAKELVNKYKMGQEPPGTTPQQVSRQDRQFKRYVRVQKIEHTSTD